MIATANTAAAGATRIARHPWMFLWPPAVTLLVAVPLAGLPFSGDPRGFWAPYTLVALPFYLGLLAAPGYVAVLVAHPADLHRSPGRRVWVRVSLAVGFLCAAVGVCAGMLMVLFLVPSLITAACCAVVWWRFERAGRGR